MTEAELSKQMATIGTAIKATREERKMQQNELARKANLSLTSLNLIENHKVHDVKVSTLLMLAKVLGVNATAFFRQSTLDLGAAESARLLKASEDILRIARRAHAGRD